MTHQANNYMLMNDNKKTLKVFVLCIKIFVSLREKGYAQNKHWFTPYNNLTSKLSSLQMMLTGIVRAGMLHSAGVHSQACSDIMYLAGTLSETQLTVHLVFKGFVCCVWFVCLFFGHFKSRNLLLLSSFPLPIQNPTGERDCCSLHKLPFSGPAFRNCLAGREWKTYGGILGSKGDTHITSLLQGSEIQEERRKDSKREGRRWHQGNNVFQTQQDRCTCKFTSIVTSCTRLPQAQGRQKPRVEREGWVQSPISSWGAPGIGLLLGEG